MAAETKQAVAGPRKKRRCKVRATAVGYYDHKRRREGNVFWIADEETEFSPRWMEKVDARTPEVTTTGAAELRRQHDEVLAERAGVSTGDGEVI